MVKFIRANLILRWLQKRYGFPIIYVIRHPAAVIESRLRFRGADWDFRPVLDQYTTDEALHEDFLGRYERLFSCPISPAKAHALIWCIENSFSLREEARRGRCLLVYYEHMVGWNQDGWRRLADALGLPEAPSTEVIQRPSQQVAKSGTRGGFCSCGGWGIAGPA